MCAWGWRCCIFSSPHSAVSAAVQSSPTCESPYPAPPLCGTGSLRPAPPLCGKRVATPRSSTFCYPGCLAPLHHFLFSGLPWTARALCGIRVALDRWITLWYPVRLGPQEHLVLSGTPETAEAECGIRSGKRRAFHHSDL